MRPTRKIVAGSLATLAFGWALAAGPAAAAPVTVLMDTVETGNGDEGAIAQVVIAGFESDAVVFVTASGEAAYQGPVGGAGILVSIQQGGATISDQSSEGQSLNMRYRSAVSHVFTLRRNSRTAIIARTEPYGSQASANREASVRLQVVAIASE